MSTARENLARHLGEASKLAVEQDAPDYWAFIARELVEAGYRPPARTVSTVEELEALPEGAVVVDTCGNVYEQARDFGLMCTGHCGRVRPDDALEFSPLTVIHEGGA